MQNLPTKCVLQSMLRAILYTLHTEDAFRTVFPVSSVVGHIHLHRAYPLALSAGDTFFLIAFDP